MSSPGHCTDCRYDLHMRCPIPATRGKLSRKDPTVMGIIRAWRRLTTQQDSPRAGKGEPTLIACSGGADSCALLLSLVLAIGHEGPSGTGPSLVVGHVMHDIRPRAEVERDRDAVKVLAERLGVEFVEAEVSVRGGSGGQRNLEAAARRARYAALAQMARERRIRFVATAHHAEDQLETVLMSLLRGTGGAGVRGLAVSRRLVGSGPDMIRLIRPMASEWCGVAVDRAMCQRLCREAGVVWREDATNEDGTRLRNALRKDVVPILRRLRPDVLAKATAASAHARAIDGLLARESVRIMTLGLGQDRAIHWPRGVLKSEPAAALGATIRNARREMCGRRGADRVSKRVIDAVVRAIRDRSTEPRSFVVGGLRIRVTAREVVMTASTNSPGSAGGARIG